MPLVYAAVLPHTPLLVPAIGKEKRDAFTNTLSAYSKVREHLASHKIENVIILAPHAQETKPFFQIQHSITYKASFEEFGDLVTTKNYRVNHVFIDYLKHYFEGTNIPWVYHTDEQAEYAATVPLLSLEIDRKIPITIIYPPTSSDLSALYRTGISLYDAIASHHANIAIIGSADLAHTLSKDAPGGFQKNAKAFDQRIVSAFEKKQFDALLTTPECTVDEVKTCSMPILAMLSGILKNLPYEHHTLSYEAPLGVGHLVMEFTI
ncbi:MAG: class III extradiol dioxygenase subunit B-like domain-containing protein [bacterium]|nr:class III extradiol dioxygenase subunit B-like domain-containing protein [bacterium]